MPVVDVGCIRSVSLFHTRARTPSSHSPTHSRVHILTSSCFSSSFSFSFPFASLPACFSCPPLSFLPFPCFNPPFVRSRCLSDDCTVARDKASLSFVVCLAAFYLRFFPPFRAACHAFLMIPVSCHPAKQGIPLSFLFSPSSVFPSAARHASLMISLRAIEQGTTIFRCVSWGTSYVVSPYHRFHYAADRMGDGTFTVTVPLRAHVVTLYSQVGDLLCWICLGFVILTIAMLVLLPKLATTTATPLLLLLLLFLLPPPPLPFLQPSRTKLSKARWLPFVQTTT